MDLCGNFGHTIDGKGRISVPATFRDQLIDDHRLVLTPFTVLGQRCIDVYPYAEWQKLLAKFEALPKFGAKSIRFQMGPQPSSILERFFYGLSLGIEFHNQ